MIIALDLQLMLEEHGYQVLPLARTAARAVELACGELPDGIIMDVRLDGGVSGIDAASKILATNDIPVIFLTGNSKLLENVSLPESARYAVLTKPVSDRLLMDTLDELVC